VVSEKYTIVINTFKREDLLTDAITHYSKCSKLEYIYIIWSESASPPITLEKEYSKSIQPKVSIL
jgi:hypothetical protein